MSPCAQVLKNQYALVTGANSGIGESIAKHLAAAGAEVAVNYVVHPEQAERVVEEITINGGKAFAIKADVSDPNEVEIMFKQLLEKFNRIDILVNNAGIQRDSPFLNMTVQQWEEVIKVNLTGYFLCAQQAARLFVKQGVIQSISKAAGKIICISSVHQIIPWSTHCNYAASKGGIMLFMKSIAQELSAQHIRVNSIAPGAIKTPINYMSWKTEEKENQLLRLIPYGRVGEPSDIAKVAVWLASEDSDYVQGETIIVDGGMCLFPGFDTGI